MATSHVADADRVRANTWHEVNERLDAQAAARIHSGASGRKDLSSEIAQLEGEWDFERVMEAEAATMVKRPMSSSCLPNWDILLIEWTNRLSLRRMRLNAW